MHLASSAIQMKIFLVFTILLSHCCYAQNCTNDSLFKRFKQDIQIELARRGVIDWDDETRESYCMLMSKCSNEVLANYADDSIPAVRCLIFSALAIKNEDDSLLAAILSRYENDTARYVNSPGDVTISWKVHDYMRTTLEWKIEKGLVDVTGYCASRLDDIKNRFGIIIPGIYHGVVSKDSLLAMDSLTVSWKGYKAVSFSISDATRTLVVSGNIFNEEIREMIRALKPGEFLYIEKIVVEDLDKARKRPPSMALQVR